MPAHDSPEPPASGIPAFERTFLNVTLRTASAFMSDNRALNKFVRESETLLALIDDCDYDQASHPVLIPRYQGMEHSSRKWSLFMVLEHLCLVNRDVLRTIDLLKSHVVPRGEIDTADYKPDPASGAEMIDQFRDMSWDFDGAIRKLMPLRGTPGFTHPWFGSFNAHDWLCFAAFHQAIHRKQAFKILALLGRA